MNHDNHPITVIEFCAGYSGLGLGIKRVLGERMQLIGLCELEGYAQANLISKMEQGLMAQVPIWSNLLTFPYRKFRGLVDIAVAGIPCQPHSTAGKRKGGSDERFLFGEWLEGLEQMQPGAIFIENVEGLLNSKMPNGTFCIAWTIEKLEAMGYRVEAGIFSAAECGAPHKRNRLFILANSNSERQKRMRECCAKERRETSSGFVASSCEFWPSKPGCAQKSWEQDRTISKTFKSSMDRATYECTNRVDRLRLLGNGVVPATAELAFRTLISRMT